MILGQTIMATSFQSIKYLSLMDENAVGLSSISEINSSCEMKRGSHDNLFYQN